MPRPAVHQKNADASNFSLAAASNSCHDVPMEMLSPLKRAVAILGSQAAAAKACGVSTSAFSNYVRDDKLPAHLCPALAAATNGHVTAHNLRPDVFKETTNGS